MLDAWGDEIPDIVQSQDRTPGVDGLESLCCLAKRECAVVKNQTARIVVVCVTLVAVCFIALVVVQRAGDGADATLCTANLFKIRHALLQYESVHGTLPPAFVPGPDGAPMHSWRALIMPYLDSWGIDAETFNADYDFGQPWNEMGNLALVTPVKDSRFACPCGAERGTTYTSYVVLRGDKTLFPDSGAVSLAAIPKEHDPILVIEIENSDIQWTDPRDIAMDEIGSSSQENTPRLCARHGRAIRYITVGGRVATLPADVAADELRRLAELPEL